jgi:hypothetical protein
VNGVGCDFLKPRHLLPIAEVEVPLYGGALNRS